MQNHANQSDKVDDFEWLKFLREEIRFEYSQTATRCGWYFTMQAFLIATYCLAFDPGKYSNNMGGFLKFSISFIGFFSSVLLALAIFVANKRIWEHNAAIATLKFSGQFKKLPSLLRIIANLYAKWVVYIFLAFWMVLTVNELKGVIQHHLMVDFPIIEYLSKQVDLKHVKFYQVAIGIVICLLDYYFIDRPSKIPRIPKKSIVSSQ